MAMEWFKVLHIIALLIWSATLFYMPGLFVAHSSTPQGKDFLELRRMTRLTYVAIASPAAVIAIASGTVLVFLLDEPGGWLPLKLTAVALMMLFHVYCGLLVEKLREAPHIHRAWLYFLLLPPSVLVPTVLWLVLAKPI